MGATPARIRLQRLAKRLDIPVLFALHNFCYFDPVAFVASDYVMVFSEYSRKYYWDSLRLACQKVPLVIDPRRVEVPQWQPQYLTFVNPEPRKGVHVFARIAEVLSLRRPDIPLLLVEGAFKAGILPQLGVDLGRLPNLKVVPNSPDPRKFLATTKLLLMPSLMENAAAFGYGGHAQRHPRPGQQPRRLAGDHWASGLPVRYPGAIHHRNPGHPHRG